MKNKFVFNLRNTIWISSHHSWNVYENCLLEDYTHNKKASNVKRNYLPYAL